MGAKATLAEGTHIPSLVTHHTVTDVSSVCVCANSPLGYSLVFIFMSHYVVAEAWFTQSSFVTWSQYKVLIVLSYFIRVDILCLCVRHILRCNSRPQCTLPYAEKSSESGMNQHVHLEGQFNRLKTPLEQKGAFNKCHMHILADIYLWQQSWGANWSKGISNTEAEKSGSMWVREVWGLSWISMWPRMLSRSVVGILHNLSDWGQLICWLRQELETEVQ